MSDKTPLTFDQIADRLKLFEFPKIDLIVGIISGASVPAKMIAELLDRPLRYIHINFRDDENSPRYENPKILNSDEFPPEAERILLVDDVSVSGKTLKCAIENLPKVTVYTFVLKGKADYVLFPEVDTCVAWPWNKSTHP
jgi:hypoxanthine phosphoribosyltransferase